MKKLVFAMLMLGLFGLPTPQAAKKNAPENVNNFMKAKLTHSQKILEGLVIADYEMIRKNANKLNLLSLESSWQVLQTPEYITHSNNFRKTTEAIANAAKKKNLDGATLAYFDMTLKCVQCHKYERSVKVTQQDGKQPAAIIAGRDLPVNTIQDLQRLRRVRSGK